jgi:hypothetical protein
LTIGLLLQLRTDSRKFDGRTIRGATRTHGESLGDGVRSPTISLQACHDADNLLNNLPPTIGLAEFARDFLGATV